jgi:PAS domain S-box-containing protein
VPIAALDLSGHVVDVNQALLAASGYSAEELKGRLFGAFLDPGDEKAARAAFGELAHGLRDSYRADRKYRTKTGDVREVDLSVSLVRGASGDPELCLAALQDVTDHKRALAAAARRAAELEAAEEERERLLLQTQRAHREIESTSRLKDEFLAMLSHELRTPLNAILGWARILRGRQLDASTVHALDVIERNATAQARLIDDLLDVSRIITGKIRLQIEAVDLCAIAAESIETVKPAADSKGVALSADIPAVLPRLAGDAQRLQQVLWNLLSNAVKFTESGGKVSLALSHDQRAVQIVVSDTGMGISPDILPYVFDRFTQGDSSTTRAHAGLGLGLAIVRHLVELHGGVVSAESSGEGKGSTFRVWLPTPP